MQRYPSEGRQEGEECPYFSLTHWLGDSDKDKKLILLRSRRDPYGFCIIQLHSTKRRQGGRKPLARTQMNPYEVLEGRVRTESCMTTVSSSLTCPLPSLLPLLQSALILHCLSGMLHQMQMTHRYKGLETEAPQIQWSKY